MSGIHSIERAVIMLIKSAIEGTCAEIPKDVRPSDLLRLGKRYKLIPLLYYGMTNSAVDMGESLDAFESVVLSNIVIDQQQQSELKKLQEAFDAHGIDYMLLKGVLLKHLYPKTEMRPMGDGDILIRMVQQEAAHAIMLELGYTFKKESAHELIYIKGTICVELHKYLIPPYNKDYYAYYGDGWKLARKSGGSDTRYEMRDEDHLVYLFTHFAKHYRDGGIGVLHMVDFFVYMRAKTLDYAYVRSELAKLKLATFYDNILATVNAWFIDAPETEMTDFITHRMFANGDWGTQTTTAMAAAVKVSKATSVKGIGWKQTLRVLFPRREKLYSRYPILKKHAYLLPFCWVARGANVVLFKRERLRNNAQTLRQTTEENVCAYQSELNYVGLDFHFKE